MEVTRIINNMCQFSLCQFSPPLTYYSLVSLVSLAGVYGAPLTCQSLVLSITYHLSVTSYLSITSHLSMLLVSHMLN